MELDKIGIIGGTGFENPDILKDQNEILISTTYGEALLRTGFISNKPVAILSRHGKEHTIPPSHVNNRANIMALKEYGCKAIIATTACGSLRENIGRGDLVLPNQFIDFTRHRDTTFYTQFEPGKLNHTAMADPFSGYLRKKVLDAAKENDMNIHPKGTVITIEGPRFSTRAESNMFRAWGADIINMSTAPEVILANEAGVPYVAIAMSTDYDCWKIDEAPVTWDEVLKIFRKNVHNLTKLIIKMLEIL